MSSANPWTDRRGLSQKGKEVHDASSPTGRRFHETGAEIRRNSASSTTNSAADLDKVRSNSIGSAFQNTSGRRRSSASSGGMFGNLNTLKRGSQDYSERRADQTDMLTQGGRVSGWFNQTFKGMQKPVSEQSIQPQQGTSSKRGVME